MRKITAVVLAIGLTGGLVVGCGAPSEKKVAAQLQTHAQKLDTANYKSTAIMTVQMDNNAQQYYVETWYESPEVYRIALGDANKTIHQIIVHNQNGMFIVSPSLNKVFRFTGNWAQNQGHIYLYDQILQQILSSKSAKMTKSGGQYTFDLPISPANDVVVKEKVEINAKTLNPQKVTLLDKSSKSVVTIQFSSFQTGLTFNAGDFDPQKLVNVADTKQAARTTMASDETVSSIEPDQTFGASLTVNETTQDNAQLLRYDGTHNFTLEEWRPSAGVAGLPSATLVDMYGVPALYSGDSKAHQLDWVNNGVEFALTSADLTLDQMEQVAISTLGQVGK